MGILRHAWNAHHVTSLYWLSDDLRSLSSPHCVPRLGIRGSFFCGQECFKADCAFKSVIWVVVEVECSWFRAGCLYRGEFTRSSQSASDAHASMRICARKHTKLFMTLRNLEMLS